jgi:hypothetical protein
MKLEWVKKRLVEICLGVETREATLESELACEKVSGHEQRHLR